MKKIFSIFILSLISFATYSQDVKVGDTVWSVDLDMVHGKYIPFKTVVKNMKTKDNRTGQFVEINNFPYIPAGRQSDFTISYGVVGLNGICTSLPVYTTEEGAQNYADLCNTRKRDRKK